MENKIKISFKEIIKILLSCIVSGLAYAVAIKCFVQKEGVNMLANGMGGVSLIFARLMGKLGLNEDVMYALFYIVCNIPILILGYKKIGKIYTLFTVFNVIFGSLMIVAIPGTLFDFMNLDPVNDKLIISILAGVLSGISSGVALKYGSSTGGIDTIITYIGLRRHKEVGRYMFIINALILLAGGLLFGDWAAMLYTIVFIYVGSVVVDVIYIRNKKRMLRVVTEMKEEVSKKLLEISKHGVTIFECEGAYSHRKKYLLETTILTNESKEIVQVIREIDPECFISSVNVNEVHGNYTMPEIK